MLRPESGVNLWLQNDSVSCNSQPPGSHITAFGVMMNHHAYARSLSAMSGIYACKINLGLRQQDM